MLANGAAQAVQTGGLTTADWALIISVCSLIVALAGFVWNVWSKFIYPKPKVRVGFAVKTLVMGDKTTLKVLGLDATNYGPGQVTLHNAIGRLQQSHFKRLGTFITNPLHNFPMQRDHTVGPFSGGLPKKLDVGEGHSSYFPLLYEPLRDEPIVDMGFVDTFGRNHWAPRKQVSSVRAAVKEAYSKADDASGMEPRN